MNQVERRFGASVAAGGNSPRTLSAGPFSAMFREGDLRYLRLGSLEIVRRVFVAVRDETWGTVPGTVRGLEIDVAEDGFRLQLETIHCRGEIDFRHRGIIEARASSDLEPAEIQVRYAMIGEAQSSFMTNRTGLCVLYPVRGCAGLPCEIETVDGSRVTGEFPRLIAPYEPFTNLRALSYEPAPGLRVDVRFQGGVFECEDQRNWSDGSFKFYSPPLTRPFPYRLEPGDEIRQEVTIRITRARSSISMIIRRSEPELVLGPELGPLPRIGLRLPATAARLGADQVRRLRLLHLSHLRVDLRPAGLGLSDRCAGAALAAELLDVPVELGLHFSEEFGPDFDREVRSLVESISGLSLHIARAVIYVAGRPMPPRTALERVREVLRRHGPDLLVGGGTIGNFAELNRDRPAPGSVDVLCYPISPQVHATDDLSLFENLEAVGDTIASARAFAGNVPVIVGPIRFHRRTDPFAQGNSGIDTDPEKADPRQKTRLGAAWTLGLLGQIAAARGDFVSLYETVGPFGVLDGDDLDPVGHLLAAIGPFAQARVHHVAIANPLEASALALSDGQRHRLLAGNLTGETRTIHVGGLDRWTGNLWCRRLGSRPPGQPERLTLLRGQTAIRFGPWEIACLDHEGGGA